MPKKLHDVVQELEAMGLDLPYGIAIKPDRRTDNIIVANEKLGFCITREAIESNIYQEMYPVALLRLREILSDPEETARVAAVSSVDNVARIEATHGAR